MSPTPQTLAPVRWYLRWGIAISALLVGALLLSIAWFDFPGRMRLILTLVGLIVGGGLADIQLGALTVRRRWIITGLAAIVFSQACYLILVWTGWGVRNPLTWRAWWLTMCASVTLTHVLILHRAAAGRNDWIERGTPWCALVTACFVGGLGLHPELPSHPHWVYWVLLSIPAGAVTLGSIVAWARWQARRATEPPKLTRVRIGTLLVVTHVAVLGLGLYIGNVSNGQESVFGAHRSELARLSEKELGAKIREDFSQLKTLLVTLDVLEHKVEELDPAMREDIPDDRPYYTPQEEELLRASFMTYLALRAALLRMVGTYSGFEMVRNPRDRARCFVLGLAAGARVYKASLLLVLKYRKDKMVRKKLNEAGYGLPPSMFDRIYEGVANKKNLDAFETLNRKFTGERETWRKRSAWPQDDFVWIESQIDDGAKYVNEKKKQVDSYRVRIELIANRIKQDAYDSIYAAQRFTAARIGDITVHTESHITVELIEKKIQPKLKPGDILVEHRNWKASNAFLPGFWPHGALYVGTESDLKTLGIWDHNEVQLRLRKGMTVDYDEIPLLKRKYDDVAGDGHHHTVIEAVGEGVIFNTIEHSLNADYIAVLRPRGLTKEQIAQVITRAFSHQGKPYDFEFDFFSADKLVCTELIYRAYAGLLNFADPKTGKLPKVMGRHTLPADEIVRKFKREFGREDAELDLVVFVDWDAEKKEVDFWYGDTPGAAEKLTQTLQRFGTFNE